jgi:hypothetical protein
MKENADKINNNEPLKIDRSYDDRQADFVGKLLFS